MTGNTFGIDLGTSNIKIYNLARKKVFTERNVIAIQNNDTVYATGDKAYEMFERTPESIEVIQPVRFGVIADVDNMQLLLKRELNKAAHGALKSSNYIIAVPTDISEVEKRAFYDLIHMTGVREKKVMFVEKPIADALGIGLDVNNAQGILVINVGGETTEISILSLGGVVLSRLLKVGGRSFDETIVNMVKKEYNLYIGLKTAETLKKELCSLDAADTKITSMKIVGRDVVSGLPRQQEITRLALEQALRDPFQLIIDEARILLERTPPELASDIIDEGIYLTGGSSSLALLIHMLSEATELETNAYNHPEESVIRGLERAMTEKQYASLVTTVSERVRY